MHGLEESVINVTPTDRVEIEVLATSLRPLVIEFFGR